MNQASKDADRVPGVPLKTFGLKERDLQTILFRSLDRLLGDEELLVIAQSRHWQEEPDLMAVDEEGKLFIFELKVWESHSENLLQVLRYGQIFGSCDYDRLNRIWQRSRGDGQSLAEAHHAKFELNLQQADFNRKQVFVVLTNGLDVETREAIRYWRSTGLDVRSWVYRAYNLSDQMFIEISPFRTADDPLEDQAESQGFGFYVVNTNLRNSGDDDRAMLSEKKVAAYFEPWKFKIARLKKGDHVFLYRSGTGVVGLGKADGKLRKSAYHGEAIYPDEEFSMGLTEFLQVDPPLPAPDVKAIAEAPDLVFRQTMFSLSPGGGKKLYAALRSRVGS